MFLEENIFVVVFRGKSIIIVVFIDILDCCINLIVNKYSCFFGKVKRIKWVGDYGNGVRRDGWGSGY